MRLLYVADASLPAEAANTLQVMKMCTAFAAAGAEVTLLARPKGVKPGKIVEPAHWPREISEFYGVTPAFKLTRARRLWPGRSRNDVWNGVFSFSCLVWALRHRKDFDVLYTRLPFLAMLASRFGIPAVYEAHRLLPDEGKKSKARARKIIAGHAKPAFLGTVSISECLKQLYVDMGFEADKIVVAHDAVDLERFEPLLSQSEARAQLRAVGLDIPDSARVVGYSGHFYTGRGIPELLECAAKQPDWTFLFVGGNARDLQIYGERARERNLNNVRFVGFVPNAQLPPYIFASDVVAMPYTSSTGSAQFMSPMKMFEYLAAGRAVVATDWPPVREVLRHEENALLIPPDCADNLEQALGRVLNDDGLRVKLEGAAREEAEHYTWAGRASELVTWIEEKLKV